MTDKIYVFGHKNPDTDSVASAISLSYLQNVLGLNTEPRILSNINEETKYVLKKFKIKVPEILDDVKLQLKDVNYHRGFYINNNESVYNAFFKMKENDMSTIPVINDNGKFLGNFAMKDIAKTEIMGDNKDLITKYDHILNVIEGKEILKFDEEINGVITNIDLRSTRVHDLNVFLNNTILITGDRHAIIEDAINSKIKLLIITDNVKIKDNHLEIAKKNKVNIIYTKLEAYTTIQRIKFANYVENYNYIKDIMYVNEDVDITDLNDIINKTKHSYYPVVDNFNNCLGLLKLSDLRDYKPKKVILVDHNELSQSAYGLNEAEIIGVFDHHKLGTLGTMEPINFRNMIVGSTCTIVYEMFKENNVKIPEHIGSLLLSGIISDTLLLKSPTTTKTDIKALNELAKLTGIDAEKLAIGMFKANDATNSKTIKEIVYTDFKSFNIENKTVGVGVITTLNSKAILKQKNSYIRFLNKESEQEKYDAMIFLITDIFKNGSYILFSEKAKEIVKEAFGENIEEGDFLEDIVSRKKQVMPKIISAI